MSFWVNNLNWQSLSLSLGYKMSLIMSPEMMEGRPTPDGAWLGWREGAVWKPLEGPNPVKKIRFHLRPLFYRGCEVPFKTTHGVIGQCDG